MKCARCGENKNDKGIVARTFGEISYYVCLPCSFELSLAFSKNDGHIKMKILGYELETRERALGKWAEENLHDCEQTHEDYFEKEMGKLADLRRKYGKTVMDLCVWLKENHLPHFGQEVGEFE